MSRTPPSLASLLSLSHELGRPDRNLAILGEGNTSARLDASTFLVKASGSNLAQLASREVTACRFAPLLELLDRRAVADAAVEEALLAARLDHGARKPSVEAMFHAWLLTLPGIAFVGHTHPVAVNSILASPQAARFAQRRLFPDEIVCCGAESVFVPYVDPGLRLAQAIRTEVTAFRRRTNAMPRVILLQNHGMIALGATPGAVLAATLMTAKAAAITLGAAALGGARHLMPRDVARIAARTDEHYRQKVLGL
ncbi:class II aldolase/adducin family protein [Opitutus terrae]|uniref:Class II aldolase/adducin family protein n=1 Tax=Opitutus terrae (strain DSM 11246 / JCM 15787 / PB90-1) TaxID=452637 RepID=B1ZTE4_OPITP|nr:class II aldolase/adducin family protein [Opitutus terrae]ACB76598.1 class II aldolase/adducin family protein [Opitutus terrae PB90-1]